MEQHEIPIPIDLDGERARKVLVVDDEATIRELVVRALEKIDDALVIEEAEDGVAGCIKLGSFVPDLLVLDLMMPKADGYTVCEKVRKDPTMQRTKILVLTGYPSPENIERALEAGADDWLAKPFEIKSFTTKVKVLLEQRQKVLR
jgi:two-component system response regulator RpaA